MKVGIDIFLRNLGEICEENCKAGCEKTCPLYFDKEFKDGSCRCCIQEDMTILRWKEVRLQVKKTILEKIKKEGTSR